MSRQNGRPSACLLWPAGCHVLVVFRQNEVRHNHEACLAWHSRGPRSKIPPRSIIKRTRAPRHCNTNSRDHNARLQLIPHRIESSLFASSRPIRRQHRKAVLVFWAPGHSAVHHQHAQCARQHLSGRNIFHRQGASRGHRTRSGDSGRRVPVYCSRRSLSVVRRSASRRNGNNVWVIRNSRKAP